MSTHVGITILLEGIPCKVRLNFGCFCKCWRGQCMDVTHVKYAKHSFYLCLVLRGWGHSLVKWYRLSDEEELSAHRRIRPNYCKNTYSMKLFL